VRFIKRVVYPDSLFSSTSQILLAGLKIFWVSEIGR